MADYSTAADNAVDALENAADGLIEEYTIGANHRSVKRGKAKDQILATALLEGLAARRAGRPICNLAKPKNPQ